MSKISPMVWFLVTYYPVIPLWITREQQIPLSGPSNGRESVKSRTTPVSN